MCRANINNLFECTVQCSAANCAAPFVCEQSTERCVPPGVLPTSTCDGVPVGTRTTMTGFQELSCVCATGALLLCDADPRACNLITDAAACAAVTDNRCCFNAGAGLCLDASSAGAAACTATVAPTPAPPSVVPCINGACLDPTQTCVTSSSRCVPSDIVGMQSGDRCNGLAVGARSDITQADGSIKRCTCLTGDILLCFANTNACGLLTHEECTARTADCCYRTAFSACSELTNGKTCVELNTPTASTTPSDTAPTTPAPAAVTNGEETIPEVSSASQFRLVHLQYILLIGAQSMIF